MSNINIGNKTEKNTVSIFRSHNYWVYNTPHKTNGQPVDIICVRGCPDIVWLLDAKHLDSSSASFPFSRIEPNQETTLLYASEFAKLSKERLGFAIEWDRTKEVYFLSYRQYEEEKRNAKNSVKIEELPTLEERIRNETKNNNIK